MRSAASSYVILPGLGFDIDDYSQRAPKPIFEHDKPVFLGFQKTLLLHELLAVERPAFIEYRRFIHQTRKSRGLPGSNWRQKIADDGRDSFRGPKYSPTPPSCAP